MHMVVLEQRAGSCLGCHSLQAEHAGRGAGVRGVASHNSSPRSRIGGLLNRMRRHSQQPQLIIFGDFCIFTGLLVKTV